MPDVSDRKGYIGGSDAAAILGISPWRSPLQVWAEKRGLVAPVVESEAMEWGTRLEELVAKKFSEVTGRKLKRESRFLTMKDFPFMGAHLDRWQWDDKRGRGVYEGKTTGASKAEQWDDEPPLHVQAQLQHYLAVTGASWGSVAVLIGGQKFRWYDMERNDRFIEALIKAESDFWKMVEGETIPPPMAQDNSILAAVYGCETEEVVELDSTFDELDIALQAAKEKKKNIEGEIQLLEAQIKVGIGKAAVGKLQSGGHYTWKTVTRSSYTVLESTFRQLRRVKA